MNIRSIQQKDNPYIAAIILQSLESANLAIEGTAYTDPHLDQLFFPSHSNVTQSIFSSSHLLIDSLKIR